MSDQDKFEGFKKKLIEDNEKEFGPETRQIYGDDVVEKSEEKVRNMNRKDYNRYG